MSGLSAFEVEAYQKNGFHFPQRIMDAQEAQVWRQRFEAHEGRRQDGLQHSARRYMRANAHYILPEAEALVRDPRILDVVEAILGPDLLCWGCEFIIKDAHSERIVSWHQDLTYWGMDTAHEEVTAWLALSPATQRSGCMRYVPGSHREAIVAHRDTFADDNILSRGQEIAVAVDEADAVDVVLQPGEMALHHGRMFHASGPNHSDDRRIGVAIRYITPAVRQVAGARDYAMLVRGIDRCNNFLHVAGPDHAFAPRALALYEEIARDQEAVLAQGASRSIDYHL